ncbi:la-related protein 6b isoform X2 [Lepisosteus oculatus]|uniref:la-related protein 6b isoform X2 n=1 Tax=Lepisosteus oculatus TaxID=7918 RepID=UPI00371833A9
MSSSPSRSLSELLRSGLQISPQPLLSAEDPFNDNLEASSSDLLDAAEDDWCEGGAWSPPGPELRRKIAAQVESYLSDGNLAEDAFLLKHVQRNRMGYVSLKLLTSFKKIRELTRDWRTTLYAAGCSEALEVNEEGTKVRRRAPIRESLLYTPTSKLLLAWNLLGEGQAEEASPGGEQQCLMETAMKLFGAHGTISSLRILRPGKELPAELKKYAKKHSELGRRVCAVVEYEYLEGARRAYEALRAEQLSAAGRGVRVALLGSRGTRKTCSTLDQEESEDPEEGGEKLSCRRPARRVKKFPCSLEDPSVYSSSESDFAPASPRPLRRVARPQALYGSPLAVPKTAPSFGPDPFSGGGSSGPSPLGSPLLPRKLFSSSHMPSPLAVPECGGSSPTACGADRYRWPADCSPDSGILVHSPWVQRRRTAAQVFFPEKPSPLSPRLGRQPQVLLEIVRQPQGPDGTRGFYNCIGRGKVLLRH